VEAKPGKTGQFDVLRDGKCIYSRDETGRFPSDDEILRQL
jgi:predicted Rdx family selenoprotein